MDATRARRTRDRARQTWYARCRQQRFARFLGFPSSAPAANDSAQDRASHRRVEIPMTGSGDIATLRREANPAAPAARLNGSIASPTPITSVANRAAGNAATALGPNRRRDPMHQITRVLEAIDRGEPLAASELLPLVYDELVDRQDTRKPMRIESPHRAWTSLSWTRPSHVWRRAIRRPPSS